MTMKTIKRLPAAIAAACRALAVVMRPAGGGPVVGAAAIACAMLLLAVHLLPEHLAATGLGTQAALEYIAYGIESAALWGAALVLAPGPLRYVAAWGIAESAARAGCRAALPLDRAPALQPGQTLCDAAAGWPVSLLSLVAALLLAAYLNHRGVRR